MSREILDRGDEDLRLPLVRDQEEMYQRVYVQVAPPPAPPPSRAPQEIAKSIVAGAVVIGIVHYATRAPKRVEVKHEEEAKEARATLLAAGE